MGRSVDFLSKFLPEKSFSPFKHINESTSLGLRLDAADMTNFNASSIASDGEFLYIHSLTKGLIRISSVGLEAGKMCGPSNPTFHIGVAGHMELIGKKLYFFYQAKTSEMLSTVFYIDTIDIRTFEIISTHILTFGASERNFSEDNAVQQNSR